MTPQAQKDMAELGLDEQALAAKQEHISQLLNGSVHQQLKASVALIDQTPDPYDALTRCENCEELKLDVKASKDGDVLLCDDCAKALAPKPRKKRSDAGKPKPKAPAIAQQPGKISAEQYERLNDLIVTAEDRRKEYEVAADNEAKALAHLEAAIRERNNFIDELAGKGK